jgi:hypothetical protein
LSEAKTHRFALWLAQLMGFRSGAARLRSTHPTAAAILARKIGSLPIGSKHKLAVRAASGSPRIAIFLTPSTSHASATIFRAAQHIGCRTDIDHAQQSPCSDLAIL